MSGNYPPQTFRKIQNLQSKIPNVMVDGKAKIIRTQPRLNQTNNYWEQLLVVSSMGLDWAYLQGALLPQTGQERSR